MIGTKLAHYEITGHLGSGGMGDVYQASDSKLRRSVAIKLLTEAFSHDKDWAARFEREARVLASLNHPHIASLYGIEEANQRKFLVMELVPGQTLAERIKRGPLPIDEALSIAKQIAEALEAAHDKGVIHRDLKPANIKFNQGNVKVLDFGLAKVLETEGSGTNLSNTPTMMTLPQGLLMGTPAYMSPEQAKGREVDWRTDLFAFGAVLYEMLTGHQAFGGEDVADILSAVLRTEPNWTLLPANVPPRIQELLQLCLEKNPKKRRQAAGDIRIDIGQAFAASQAASTPPARSSRAAWIAAGAAALVAAVFAIPGILYLRETPLSMPVVRFNTELGTDASLASKFVDLRGFSVGSAVLLSPNGRVLVFAGTKTPVDGSKTQLFVRSLDQLKVSPLAGTRGARNAFFSPDGQWIAFFADRKLKKISVTGGAPVTLCDAPDDRGGTWSDDDSIIFAPNGSSGLMRVPSGGGTPESLTKLVPPEVTHRWPNMVRGGRAVLFAADDSGTGFEDANIIVQSLQTGQRKVVKRGGYQPHYLTSGHLLYIHDGTLFAAPFNMDRMELSAPPAAVLEGVMSSPGSGGSQFAVSENGVLAYLPGSSGAQSNSMVWVDRQGTPQPLLGAAARVYANPRLSPDGRSVALSVSDGGMEDIWTYDVMRHTLTRLSLDGAGNSYPVWTPDGKRVVYRSSRGGQPNLYWTAADGTGTEDRLTTSENMQTPLSVSPDGDTLVYAEQNPRILFDLMALALKGDRKPQMVRQTPFNNRIAQFSPDGKWLAYVSDESTQYQVYVQPFPGTGGKQLVSTESGAEIFWAKNGELFYRTGTNQEKMMAVDIQTQPALSIGKPRQLFEGPYVSNAQAGSLSPNYAVSADGQRFLMIKSSEQAQSAPSRVTVVLNWLEELKLKVPTHP